MTQGPEAKSTKLFQDYFKTHYQGSPVHITVQSSAFASHHQLQNFGFFLDPLRYSYQDDKPMKE